MANFALRHTDDAARFLGPRPRWVNSGCWNREPKGGRLPSLVERRPYWKAPLFGSHVLFRTLPTAARFAPPGTWQRSSERRDRSLQPAIRTRQADPRVIDRVRHRVRFQPTSAPGTRRSPSIIEAGHLASHRADPRTSGRRTN